MRMSRVLKSKGNGIDIASPWSVLLIPPCFFVIAAPITALINPDGLHFVVLMSLVLAAAVGAAAGIAFVLKQAIEWSIGRPTARVAALTLPQIDAYASAATQLEDLADDVDAGRITSAAAASRLAAVLDVLGEASLDLSGPLKERAALLLVTNHADSGQVRRYLQFIHKELDHANHSPIS